jgi:hypothetical protein
LLVNWLLVTRLLCGPLAAWAGAWLNGTAAFDDVLTAASLETPAGSPSALGEILIAWRQAQAQVRLVLPVPGDVRGLSGPAAFRTAALDIGQAVVGVGREISVGALPLFVDHRPSSAPPTLTWQRFEIEQPIADYVSVTDAQYELTEAIRECASTLARLQLGAVGGDSDLPGELGAARRAGERINLPAGFPTPAVSLIAQAERMAAVLALASAASVAAGPADPVERTEVLAPLVVAVRRARLAGYNAGV